VSSTTLRTQQAIDGVTDQMLPAGLGGVGYGFVVPETPYSSNAALFGAGSYGAMDGVMSAGAADALQASRASSTSALMGLSLANIRSQSSRETVTGSRQILKEAGNAAAGVWNGVVGIGEFAVNTYVNGLGAASGDPGYLSASALRLPYDGNGQFGPGVEFFAAALATRGGKGTLAEAEAVAVRNGTVGINRINATSYQGEMLGASGAQTASKTVWKGSGRERIDVENPAPGIRPGQIHYQGTDGAKYYYDPNTRSFFDQRTGDLAPRKVQDLVQNSGFSNAIDKALNGYLGAKR